jgi:hypothetical protein
MLGKECEHDWYEYSDSYTGSGTHCYICRKCNASVRDEPESHKRYREEYLRKYWAEQEAKRKRDEQIDHTGD